MENTEVMQNEEVAEVIEDVVANKHLPKCLKIAGIVGLAVVAGYMAYRYIGKPRYLKHKEKMAIANDSSAVVADDDSLEEVTD